MSASPTVTVSVTRQFAATPEQVFDTWLNPALIGKFMFGPQLRDEEVLHLNVTPQVGGTFSFLVQRQGNEVDHIGTYREIDRPRRLVFTWSIAGMSNDESVVTIEIRASETGSRLTLTHEMDAKWAEYASRTEAGWSRMLAALESVLG
jgi:uncharacterized protein YndB with AHSA1/START domain